MNVVSYVIVMVLAVIGLASLLRALSLRLFRLKDDGTVLYITHIRSGSENAEFVLRSALSRQRWCAGFSRGIVCVDCPLDEKTRRICEGVCREYGFHTLMTKEEFLKSRD